MVSQTGNARATSSSRTPGVRRCSHERECGCRTEKAKQTYAQQGGPHENRRALRKDSERRIQMGRPGSPNQYFPSPPFFSRSSACTAYNAARIDRLRCRRCRCYRRLCDNIVGHSELGRIEDQRDVAQCLDTPPKRQYTCSSRHETRPPHPSMGQPIVFCPCNSANSMREIIGTEQKMCILFLLSCGPACSDEPSVRRWNAHRSG